MEVHAPNAKGEEGGGKISALNAEETKQEKQKPAVAFGGNSAALEQEGRASAAMGNERG